MNIKNINNVNNLIVVILTGLIIFSSSCIKADNYDPPQETFRGTIYDSITGLPLQLDFNEARIELLELSWTATTPTLNPFFYANDSGYFNNTRLFKGFYNVNISGPFVPINHKLWPAPNTDTTNNTPNITIKGVTVQNFVVASMLNIKWVTEPQYNASDSSVSATVIITRGTSNPLYDKNPIKNINFYANEVPYPGDGNYDNRYSRIKAGFPANETIEIGGVINSNVFEFGKPYIVKTTGKLTPRKWWFRVGANTTRALPTGTPYNYSTIKMVDVK
ncbi:MAG: DUF3823 domain-containing protein [Ginsengibacter sp.]